MSATTSASTRRKYGHCAKGPHPKELSTGYVCDEHVNTPGLFNGCASCGTPWPDGESRDYVCRRCLADYLESLERRLKGYDADMTGTLKALDNARERVADLERELDLARVETATDVEVSDDQAYHRGYHQAMRDMFVHTLTWKISRAGSGDVGILDQLSIPIYADEVDLGAYLEHQMDLYFTSPDNCGWDEDWAVSE